jgi:hypothetical protein
MPLKPRFSARLALFLAAGVTFGLFAYGRNLSASEQVPSQSSFPAPAPATQAGAQAPGAVLRITADDAVRMALENNLGIQAERLGPDISTLAIAAAEQLPDRHC